MGYRKKEMQQLSKLGFYPTPRSGAGISAEDGGNGFFHIQLKITKQPYYKLKVKDIEKLFYHALLHGEHPLFAIYFEVPSLYVLLSPLIDSDNVRIVRKSVRLYADRADGWGLKFVEGCIDNDVWGVKVVPPHEVAEYLKKLKSVGGRRSE